MRRVVLIAALALLLAPQARAQVLWPLPRLLPEVDCAQIATEPGARTMPNGARVGESITVDRRCYRGSFVWSWAFNVWTNDQKHIIYPFVASFACWAGYVDETRAHYRVYCDQEPAATWYARIEHEWPSTDPSYRCWFRVAGQYSASYTPAALCRNRPSAMIERASLAPYTAVTTWERP